MATKIEMTMPMRSKVFRISTGLFLLAALSFLYCFFFLPPFLPINSGGDSLLYLAPGQRMYQGEMMYRDVFEFLTPGTALVNFFMFKIFGLRPWIPNLLALLLSLGLVSIGIVISKKLVRPSLALLPSAVFLVATRAFLYDPTHHWYSALAALAAIAVLLEKRTPSRIAVAGILSGLSACFTQTRGIAVLVGFAVYLWWESRRRQEGWRNLLRREAWLVTGFLAICLAVNGYFIWEAGPAHFFWCTVIFVLKYYPKEANSNTFQGFIGTIPAFFPLRTSFYPFARSLAQLAVTPLVLVLFFARYWRESSRKPLEYWERPMLVAVVGFFMLLSIAPAPGDVRMAASMLPALILLAWFLDSRRRMARAIVVTLTAGTLLAAFYSVAAHRPRPAGLFATPMGRFAITDPNTYREYVWIQQHTRPMEYFFQDMNYDTYFYLNLRNPTPLSVIKNNGYTTAEQVEEVVKGIEKHQVRYLLFCGGWADGQDQLPEWESPSDNHIGPLRAYIHSNYVLVKVFPNADEIWQKRTE